jgi:hypothetical protein
MNVISCGSVSVNSAQPGDSMKCPDHGVSRWVRVWHAIDARSLANALRMCIVDIWKTPVP